MVLGQLHIHAGKKWVLTTLSHHTQESILDEMQSKMWKSKTENFSKTIRTKTSSGFGKDFSYHRKHLPSKEKNG